MYLEHSTFFDNLPELIEVPLQILLSYHMLGNSSSEDLLRYKQLMDYNSEAVIFICCEAISLLKTNSVDLFLPYLLFYTLLHFPDAGGTSQEWTTRCSCN
jgi:hypothetical protein